MQKTIITLILVTIVLFLCCGCKDNTGKIYMATPCVNCNGIGYFIVDCKYCYGDGKIQCYSCKGRGLIDCEICNGNGCIACRGCSGSGMVSYSKDTVFCHEIPPTNPYQDVTPYWRTELKTIIKHAKCMYCDGRGFIDCKDCGGKGFNYCVSCYGKGYNSCHECDGKGKVKVLCQKCFGSCIVIQ